MFALKLLGGASLEGPEGPVTGRAVQRRRLALLALLAAHGDRPLSRDKLLAFLWPESPTDSARHLLSEAVYVLRKTLGDNAILAAGDDLLLGRTVVANDVHSFEEALGSGAHERALELYRGPFLDGFFAQAGAEFEHWVERERRRLQQQAVAAAWLVARRKESEGELQEAAAFARRAVTLSEGDESAVQGLIALLAKSGNRASALVAYDEFVRELRDEYDLEPSEETRRLAESIRAPAAGAARFADDRRDAGAASVVSPLLDVRLAVLPFAVHGPDAMAYLRDALAELLSIALDGAGGLRAVHSQAIVAAQGAARDHEDVHGARALARQFGARLCVIGRGIAQGERLLVQLSVHDLAREDGEVVKLAATGSAARLPELVDELAARVIGGLATNAWDRLTAVAAATAGSLSVLRAWLEGERTYRAGSTVAAVEWFERAVREDPAFALAHYRIAAIVGVFAAREQERAASAMRRALQHVEALDERDRDLFEAFSAFLNGAASAAERVYSRLVRLYPQDAESWLGLALVLLFYNPLRGRSTAEALDAFERAMALDPGFAPAQVGLAYCGAQRGQLEALDFLCELPLVSDLGLQMRTARSFVRGDRAEQEHWLAELRRAGNAAVAEAARYGVAINHDPAAAIRIARLLTEADRLPAARGMGHATMACLELARGRWDAAEHELQRLSLFDAVAEVEYRALFRSLPFVSCSVHELKSSILALEDLDLSSPPSYPGECLAIAVHDGLHPLLRSYLMGLLSARLGDAVRTLTIAAELPSLVSTEHGERDGEAPRLASDLAWSLRAWTAWWSGEVEEALNRAERARFEALNEPLLYSAFRSRAPDRYLRGRILEQFGRGREALGWYASLEEYALHDAIFLPDALRGCARIHEANRDLEAAQRSWIRLADLLRECDPQLEALRQEAERSSVGGADQAAKRPLNPRSPATMDERPQPKQAGR